MRLALLLAAAVILIGDDSLKPWFDSLRNKLGLYCCAEADGHPLDDLSGTSRTIASAFFVQGEWTIVPDDAVLLGPNKFGKAIVWFRDPWGVKPSSRIQCFIPDRAFKAEPLSEARQVAANVTKLSGLVLRT